MPRSDGEVIFAVLCGLREYVRILMRYIRRALSEGVIDRIHLWNYPVTEADRRYTHEVAEGDARITVFSPSLENLKLAGAVKQRTRAKLSPYEKAKLYIRRKFLGQRYPYHFTAFYDHYAKHLKDEDIVIKSDNDIVYVKNLASFIEFVRSSNHTMSYPNIINNSPAVGFQSEEGMFTEMKLTSPRTPRRKVFKRSYVYEFDVDWPKSPAVAIALHEKFLSAPDSFLKDSVHVWNDRRFVTTNMFAMRGRECREYFAEYCNRYTTRYIDDAYFSLIAPGKKEFSAAMYMNAVVSHFQYNQQLTEDTPPEQRVALLKLLERYEQLAP